MPGLFDTSNLDEDVRNPPPRFGVGARGSSYLNMNPRMLAQLLQAKMQQRQQQQAMAAKQAVMSQQQAREQQIIASLSPQEQQDARTFGLKYVADQRKARAASGALDQRAMFHEGRADERHQGTLDAKSASTAEKQRLASMILKGNMQPIMDRAAQSDNAAMGEQAAMAGASAMPGGSQYAQMIQPQQQMAQQAQNQARTLTPTEWKEISEAQGKAGVPQVVPPGFQLQEDIIRQREDAEKVKVEQQKAAALQAEQQGRSKGEALATQYLGKTSDQEAALWRAAMSDPKAKPWNIASKIISDREKKNALVEKLTGQNIKSELTESGKIAGQIDKLKKENSATTDTKDGMGKVTGTKNKLNQEQIDINKAAIHRLTKRLREIESGSKTNSRADELMEKWNGEDSNLTPEELQELKGHEQHVDARTGGANEENALAAKPPVRDQGYDEYRGDYVTA